MKILLYLLIVIVLFVSLPIDAEESETSSEGSNPVNTASAYSRLCEEEDLYGLWKVVKWLTFFEVKGKDWEKPGFMKNQWFQFDGEGGMKSISTNNDMKLDDVREKLFDLPFNLSVVFERKGFMIVKPKKKISSGERWRCSIAEENILVKELNIELKKDDLIMTLFGKDNQILYFRLLRRVASEDNDKKDKTE